MRVVRGNDSGAPLGLYAAQTSVLALGLLLGLLAAYGLLQIEIDPSAEIRRAEELGIVSIGIQEGASKRQDLLAYLCLLVLPAAGAIGLWLGWSTGRRGPLLDLLPERPGNPQGKDRWWRVALVGVGAAYLLASFNLSHLNLPGFNRVVGPWLLLGEEGENLAWAQSILEGGVYGRDFFCLYGPMLVYPLAWAMKLFGPSVLVERVLRYVFDLFAFGIVLAFLYRAGRWRSSLVLFGLIYLLLFPTFRTLSINFTYLRFALGLCPILLLHLYLERPRPWLLLVAGAVLGQSLLFSQEAGVSALAGVWVALALRAVPDRDWRGMGEQTGWIATGVVVSVAPMLLYLTAQGALGGTLESLVESPRLVMLGYGWIQAPDLGGFLARPFSRELLYFWVIGAYSLTLVHLLRRLLLGRIDRDDVLSWALLIFGSLLYVVAVRRYAPENIVKVWLPAVILVFLALERSLASFFVRRGPTRYGALLGALALVALSLGLYASSLDLKASVGLAREVLLDGKWSRPETALVLPEPAGARLGGVELDGGTAEAIWAIGTFLDGNASREEPVYFFPNEAAYYFLFDRRNPTRFPMAYLAATSAQRTELIADLEEEKPRFVFYSRDTWRVDDIAEQVQVPEVVRYLQGQYSLRADFGRVVVLEREDARSRRGDPDP